MNYAGILRLSEIEMKTATCHSNGRHVGNLFEAIDWGKWLLLKFWHISYTECLSNDRHKKNWPAWDIIEHDILLCLSFISDFSCEHVTLTSWVLSLTLCLYICKYLYLYIFSARLYIFLSFGPYSSGYFCYRAVCSHLRSFLPNLGSYFRFS